MLFAHIELTVQLSVYSQLYIKRNGLTTCHKENRGENRTITTASYIYIYMYITVVSKFTKQDTYTVQGKKRPLKTKQIGLSPIATPYWSPRDISCTKTPTKLLPMTQNCQKRVTLYIYSSCRMKNSLDGLRREESVGHAGVCRSIAAAGRRGRGRAHGLRRVLL